jgi:hypothetical protein
MNMRWLFRIVSVLIVSICIGYLYYLAYAFLPTWLFVLLIYPLLIALFFYLFPPMMFAIDVRALVTNPSKLELTGTLAQFLIPTTTEIQIAQDRFVNAAFFSIGLFRRSQISMLKPLLYPRFGARLEFRVWVDLIKTGIRWQGEQPAFISPVSYPVDLRISLWSDDFRFKQTDAYLTLRAKGATKYAKFRINGLPPTASRAEIFVFIRWRTELVATLRVGAVMETSRGEHSAQALEVLYLNCNWFRSTKLDELPVRTILFTKKDSRLHIFTLNTEGTPWSSLGPTETNLYEHNKEMYRDLHRLALAAAEASEANKLLSVAKEFNRLAEYGYRLFSDIFFWGSSSRPATFYHDHLKELPEGSCVTIIMDQKAENLIVPWGLLYDRLPPYGFATGPERSAFWGYRYNVVIRPWFTRGRAGVSTPKPLRMGAAWLKHAESDALKEDLKPFQEAGTVLLEPIRVEDYSIPALANGEFDLVEFFCHGHTKLENVFADGEANMILENYRRTARNNSGLLMAISQSSDSLVELDGGFATLASLAVTLRDGLRGNPLILLSMCESAQVSSSGGGFVWLFLKRGASAVIGTEGPTLWSLSRAMDVRILARLINGESISQAFYKSRRELADGNMLALIYTLYGDPDARLVSVPVPEDENEVLKREKVDG